MRTFVGITPSNRRMAYYWQTSRQETALSESKAPESEDESIPDAGVNSPQSEHPAQVIEDADGDDDNDEENEAPGAPA